MTKKSSQEGSLLTRGHHDLGGESAGSIDRHEHTPTLTERRVDAMMMLLRDDKRHFFTTDEHRRTIESLLPSFQEIPEYYEKWVHGIRSLMIEKGVLTPAEVEMRHAEVKRRYQAAGGRVDGGAPAAASKAGKTSPKKSSIKSASRSKGAKR